MTPLSLTVRSARAGNPPRLFRKGFCTALGLAAVGFGPPLLHPGTARAQQAAAPSPPTTILFVGNSFTFGKGQPVRGYNADAVTDENFHLPESDPRFFAPSKSMARVGGVPGIFKKMTTEAGLDYEVHVETVGGKALQFHYEHELPLIARPSWNVVVLQEYSTSPLPEFRSGKAGVQTPAGDAPPKKAGAKASSAADGEVPTELNPDPGKTGTAAATPPGETAAPIPAPSPLPGGNSAAAAAATPTPSKIESFFKHATLLEQTVHAANPAAKVYLYATWPRADLTYPPGKMYAGEKIDAMGKDLHDGYYREFAENGHFAGLAPVGDAWLRAIHDGLAQENPYEAPDEAKLNLWSTDHYHPSVSGAYLAALVLFQQITGKDARTLGKAEQAAADLGLSPENAARLQQVANEQVIAGLAAARK